MHVSGSAPFSHLALAWPWQEPGQWAIALLAWLAVGLGARVGMTAVRRQTAPRRRRVGWLLLGSFVLCCVLSVAVLLFVVPQMQDTLATWLVQDAQHANQCSMAYEQATFQQGQHTIGVMSGVGLGCGLAGLAFFAVLASKYPLWDPPRRDA